MGKVVYSSSCARKILLTCRLPSPTAAAASSSRVRDAFVPVDAHSSRPKGAETCHEPLLLHLDLAAVGCSMELEVFVPLRVEFRRQVVHHHPLIRFEADCAPLISQSLLRAERRRPRHLRENVCFFCSSSRHACGGDVFGVDALRCEIAAAPVFAASHAACWMEHVVGTPEVSSRHPSSRHNCSPIFQSNTYCPL